MHYGFLQTGSMSEILQYNKTCVFGNADIIMPELLKMYPGMYTFGC